MSENYELKVGSKYLVKTSEEEDTIGCFVGYSMIGTESAVVISTEGNRVRFIPVAQIVYIDLLQSAEEPERRAQPEHLYG